jgi:hypothetical protein
MTEPSPERKQGKGKMAIDRTLEKFRSKGLYLAADFLSNKRLRAASTAQTYYFALDYLNGCLERKDYNVQTVIDALVQKKLDIYKLLSGYVSYLKDETKNGHDMSGKTVKIYVENHSCI